ncbi:MAG: acyl-CoA carboxylase subunit beta [bacterium]
MSDGSEKKSKKQLRLEKQAADNRAAWAPLQDELHTRREKMRAMGGADRVKKYMHDRGKLDARQRIEALFDDGTFQEIGLLVGTINNIPAEGFVCGSGKVNGRTVLAGAEDFSVLGGSIGTGGSSKRYRIAELAAQEQVPLVMMLEGAGHRLTEEGGGRAPGDLQAMADLSGQVPMVCLVLGPAAGHGALAAPLSDFVVMTESASMFTGGPPLVKASTGEDVTKEELGGAKICVEIAGSAHNVAKDDTSAIELARRYLGYFPQYAGGVAPLSGGTDTQPRSLDDMVEIVPPDDRKPYDIHHVIERMVDTDSFLEIQPSYGRAIVVGLAHMGGRAVAIVANNPAQYAGAVDPQAAIKATDFLEHIGNFGHPVIFLADNPGVMAGPKAERGGILKWGGKMYRAERRLKNAKIHVTMRKAFGFGSVVMAHNPHDKQTLSISLPGVTMAAMPASSGGPTAKLSEEDQAAAEAAQAAGPYKMAHGLVYDDIIEPSEIRDRILGGIGLLEVR